MKKVALAAAVWFFLCMLGVVFGDTQSKTDKEWDKQLLFEKLERFEGAFNHIVDQEDFFEATAYTYGQLLNAIAESPIGTTTFFHAENDVGVFNVTVATQIIDGQLFHVGRLTWEKHIVAPLYNATLFWNMWSNESDNKEFVLTIFAAEDKDGSVFRHVKFPVKEKKLGNPVFVSVENIGDIHHLIGGAEDKNGDGIVDFIRITETYLDVKKTITAKKLGGSFSGGTEWNDIEICENDVCKKITAG